VRTRVSSSGNSRPRMASWPAPSVTKLGGVQYVAVVAGYGGGFGIGEGADKTKARPHGRVLSFRLDGPASLPAFAGTLGAYNTAAASVEGSRFDGSQVDQGRLLYTQQCYRCHGAGAQSSGVLPDLRRSAALSNRAAWNAILMDGALESAGMVSFKRWLTPEQIEDIRAYVAFKAKLAAQRDEHSANARQ
jgi:quinohemoprotein ethanol dehydrogenase